MRILIVLSVLLLSCRKTPTATVKYPECETFIFDAKEGTINSVKPNLPQSEIREWLPCYSRFTPDGAEADCGGGFFYDQYNFSIYTYLDNYLEVKKGFKGRGDSMFLMTRKQLRQALGTPVQNSIATDNPDQDFFSMDYGCLRVLYKDSLPVSIASHFSDCESLLWCGDE